LREVVELTGRVEAEVALQGSIDAERIRLQRQSAAFKQRQEVLSIESSQKSDRLNVMIGRLKTVSTRNTKLSMSMVEDGDNRVRALKRLLADREAELTALRDTLGRVPAVGRYVRDCPYAFAAFYSGMEMPGLNIDDLKLSSKLRLQFVRLFPGIAVDSKGQPIKMPPRDAELNARLLLEAANCTTAAEAQSPGFMVVERYGLSSSPGLPFTPPSAAYQGGEGTIVSLPSDASSSDSPSASTPRRSSSAAKARARRPIVDDEGEDGKEGPASSPPRKSSQGKSSRRSARLPKSLSRVSMSRALADAQLSSPAASTPPSRSKIDAAAGTRRQATESADFGEEKAPVPPTVSASANLGSASSTNAVIEPAVRSPGKTSAGDASSASSSLHVGSSLSPAPIHHPTGAAASSRGSKRAASSSLPLRSSKRVVGADTGFTSRPARTATLVASALSKARASDDDVADDEMLGSSSTPDSSAATIPPSGTDGLHQLVAAAAQNRNDVIDVDAGADSDESSAIDRGGAIEDQAAPSGPSPGSPQTPPVPRLLPKPRAPVATSVAAPPRKVRVPAKPAASAQNPQELSAGVKAVQFAVNRGTRLNTKLESYRELLFFNAASRACWIELRARLKPVSPDFAHDLTIDSSVMAPITADGLDKFMDFTNRQHPCQQAMDKLPTTPIFFPASVYDSSVADTFFPPPLSKLRPHLLKLRGLDQRIFFQALWERTHWILDASVKLFLENTVDALSEVTLEAIDQLEDLYSRWQDYVRDRSLRADRLRLTMDSYHKI
ncbi:hypothetical protein BBJ28_00026499, partial [Nothophytophthora sp. Chile5]